MSFIRSKASSILYTVKSIFQPAYHFMSEECPVISILFLVVLVVPVSIIISTHTVLAENVIRIIKPHSAMDQRHLYNNAILSKALDKTIRGYGDYKIEFTHSGTQRDRALVELISGRNINVHIVPTRNEWEEKTLPIRIPIVKGILGYRLFLIKRQNIKKFSYIKSLDELKVLRAGLRQQWSTTKAMNALGFQVITGNNYEGLFHMLINNRFDYFPGELTKFFQSSEAEVKTCRTCALNRVRRFISLCQHMSL